MFYFWERVTQIPNKIGEIPKARAQSWPWVSKTISKITPDIIWPAMINIAVYAAPIRAMAQLPAAINSTPIGPPK